MLIYVARGICEVNSVLLVCTLVSAYSLILSVLVPVSA